MADRVLLVTSPDDTIEDGFRILLIDLNQDQKKFMSQVLGQLNTKGTIIAYVWNHGDPIDWAIDKKHKSSQIIFNADSENQTFIGYLAGQKNSSYFGTLRSLNCVNKSAILTANQCCELIENRMEK